jgi:acetyltransferase-like isoleucine patch superfamily enzyme
MRLFWNKKKKNLHHSTTIVSSKARISADSKLGKYCYVGNYADVTKAEIGNYVSIANNVAIGPGEHDLHRISTSSAFYKSPYAQLTEGTCVIGADTWIGVNAVIRRGVVVGIGAVIGANSFVNKDVPPFGIVGGSPARLIGYRFTEKAQAVILASNWWDLDLEQAKILVEELSTQVKTHSAERT